MKVVKVYVEKSSYSERVLIAHHAPDNDIAANKVDYLVANLVKIEVHENRHLSRRCKAIEDLIGKVVNNPPLLYEVFNEIKDDGSEENDGND